MDLLRCPGLAGEQAGGVKGIQEAVEGLGLLREAVLHLPAEPADGLTSPSPAVRRLVDRSEPTQMA